MQIYLWFFGKKGWFYLHKSEKCSTFAEKFGKKTMVLNYIWISLILLAVLMGIVQAVFFGQTDIFTELLNSTFANAKTGFELALGLTGVLTFWTGVMKIGEQGGVINTLSRGVAPFFSRIFPEVPKGHKVFGSMLMNVSANVLGLDNAATPMGLKAMAELQEINPDKKRASNAMIMFIVLGASGLTIVPTSIMAYRAQLGAANPADVFLPILIATYVSTLVGLLACCVIQKINILDKVVLGTIVGLTALMGGLVVGASMLEQEQLTTLSAGFAAIFLLAIITWFIIQAASQKVNVYEAFIDGAKDGFKTAVSLIPFMVAILVAVGMFRTSGAMDLLEHGLAWVFEKCGINPSMAGAVPTALMKPLSGGGARGLMIEAMTNYGADSLVGRLCCILQGTTDTTFYVLAVYFGSVDIKETRHAVACCLLSDFAGMITAFIIAPIFFG